MRFIVALAILFNIMVAQGQRTPGRVGGSVNLPTAHSQAAKKSDSAILSPDEKQQYEEAKKQIPKLTVQDFFVLRATARLAQNAPAMTAKIQTVTPSSSQAEPDVSRFATAVAATNNDPAKALEQMGLTEVEARKIYDQAKRTGKAELKSRRK